MRILVTGGHGFLGTHICNRLKLKGIKDLKNIDSYEKAQFICTCDAMIHASIFGETFGFVSKVNLR